MDRNARWRKMLAANWYIYALVDPRDNAIRYVGCSMNPKKRLADHCSHSENDGVRRWVAELRSHGLRPRLEILHKRIGAIDAQTCEAECIVRYGRDHDLFNRKSTREKRLLQMSQARKSLPERQEAKRRRVEMAIGKS